MNELVEYGLAIGGAATLLFGLFNAATYMSITKYSRYQRTKLSRRDTMTLDRELRESSPLLYKLTPIGRKHGLRKIGFYP